MSLDLAILAPTLPTKEELAQYARATLEGARATYLENWPAELTALSIRGEGFALSRGETLALLAEIWAPHGGENFDPSAEWDTPYTRELRTRGLASVEARIAEILTRFPEGAFVRLGSRSPKDSFVGLEEGFRVASATQAMRILLDSAQRVGEDLDVAFRAGYAPHIFLREWLEIPSWAEFRCFTIGRRLVGISQYDYRQGKVFPELAERTDEIRAAIEAWFPRFAGASHLDDVVFDVVLEEKDGALSCRLLEINPDVRLGRTDPCLFRQHVLDGAFRYLGDGTAYDFARR